MRMTVIRRLPRLIALASILLALGAEGVTVSGSNSSPNVVFILADDLGWADVGYHNSDTATPNIDRLAAGGTRLEQHYVWPTCSPTRVALLTGREPSRFGVLGPILKGDGGLPPNIVTLPGALRSKRLNPALFIGQPRKSRQSAMAIGS